VNDKPRPKQSFLLGAISLISLGGTAVEITLSRVFSVLFFYHYVFAILSIAMLGIGLGAALVHQRAKAPKPGRSLLQTQTLSLLSSLAVLALALTIVATVSIDGRLLLAVASAIPYLLLGMALATLFSAWPAASPTLYAADLAGAGLGAAAAIPLLNWLGGLDALLFTVLVFAVGSFLFGLASGRSMKHWQSIGSGGMVVAVAALLAFGGLELDMGGLATPKPLTEQLQQSPGSRVVYTHWDAFARVDLLETTADSSRKQVYINGAAGSIMPRLPSSVDDEQRVTDDIGYFPFAASPPKRVFVLGPGGGKDVLFALLAGSQNITAVEVSPGVVQAVRRYADYNGGLFNHPYVTVAVDEGRSYLRRSGDQFDLISLSEVIALTAERGSYILAENYAYTVEALHDYLDALAPGGRIALKLYDEYTLTRAFTTAITALRERGLDEAAATRRMAVLLDPSVLSEQAPFRSPLLILYRDPVSPQAAEELLSEIEQAGYIPLFVPHVHERPPLSALTSGQTTLEELVDNFARADVSPTTDDRPFFYEFRRGLPELLRQLLAALGIVTGLGLAYLLLAARRNASRPEPAVFWSLVLYFALLGAGFMLVEVAVIQQLTLFLGHPTTALTASLFAALVSSGLGSVAGGRLSKGRTKRTLLFAALLGGLLALIYTGLIPLVTDAFLALALPARIATAMAIAFPLFFALGMPFPLGLQVAERWAGPSMVPLAWGVNGVTSVIGSVGGIAIAILWGFDTVLVAGGLVYLAIALLARRARS
jgi:predicted membrane-bound spermidine synthase